MRRAAMRAMVAAALGIGACGGGGSELQADAPPPWEIDAGVCTFDDERAYLIAMDMGARCRVVMWGNRNEGTAVPQKSWPSSGNLSK